MKRIDFDDLVVGNTYYDIRPDVGIPQVKMKLTSKNEKFAFFRPIGDYNCYDGDEDGLIRFSKTHFYKPEFTFGR